MSSPEAASTNTLPPDHLKHKLIKYDEIYHNLGYSWPTPEQLERRPDLSAVIKGIETTEESIAQALEKGEPVITPKEHNYIVDEERAIEEGKHDCRWVGLEYWQSFGTMVKGAENRVNQVLASFPEPDRQIIEARLRTGEDGKVPTFEQIASSVDLPVEKVSSVVEVTISTLRTPQEQTP